MKPHLLSLCATTAVLLVLLTVGPVWNSQAQQEPDETSEGTVVPTDASPTPSEQPRSPAVARKPGGAATDSQLTHEVGTELVFVRHTPPAALRDRLFKRLHEEALHHFFSDPRNGLARMPVVYERMIREWPLPEFATGELGTAREIPFEDDLKRIHAGSLKDFNEPKDVSRRPDDFRRILSFQGFDQKKFEAKKVWEAKSIDLIGLIKHKDPTAYVSEKLPNMKSLDTVPTRSLDDFESSGLSTLYSGRDYYARTDNGVIRLLGAVRARKDCLSCHTARKEGDLLGAFSYTLREAKYERNIKRFLNPMVPRIAPKVGKGQLKP